MKKEKLAKMKILKKMKDSLKKESSSGFDKSLKPSMKVSVMADSPKGLEEGLDKAEEILKKRKSMFKDGGVKDYKNPKHSQYDLDDNASGGTDTDCYDDDYFASKEMGDGCSGCGKRKCKCE